MIRLLAILGLALVLAVPASAQTGGLSGTVVDESGGVVPGASVQLTGAGGRAFAVTGSDGSYSFNNLTNGTYQLTVSLPGFSQVTRGDLVVGGSNVVVPAITLTLSRLEKTVMMTASKMESTLINAPSTISVMTSDMLSSTPAQNYSDLLRSIPDINMIQLSTRNMNITNHQTTSTLSNSQLILLNRKSLYLDFFKLVL